MQAKFKSFLSGMLILTAVIILGAYLLFTQFIPQYYLPIFPWLLLFYVVSTTLVHYFHLKARFGDSKRFPRYAMAINGMKIFAYLIFIVVYIFTQRDTAVPFLIGFFGLYMLFNIYEVMVYQRSNRPEAS